MGGENSPSHNLNVPADRPPLFVGAGVIRTPEEIERFAAIPQLASLVIGSFSYDRNEGADPSGDKTVTYWDETNQAFYNAIGLRNVGREAAGEFLPESIKKVKAAGQLAILSITSLYGEDPREVLPVLAEWAVSMGADAIEVNGACPNEGSHQVLCNNMELTTASLGAIRQRIGPEPYLIFKVAPMSEILIRRYVPRINEVVNAVSVNNNCRIQSPINHSTGRHQIEVNDGYAGESGPIIKGLSRQNLRMWKKQFQLHGAKIPEILSIGGVDNGIEAYLRVHNLGALMVGGAQAFYRADDPALVAQKWADEYQRTAKASASGSL